MPAIQNPFPATILGLICLTACPNPEARPAAPAAAAVIDAGGVMKADGRPPEVATTQIAACVDGWLAKQGLNQYGDAPDTMYMGGTPLFDERSGKRVDRIALILKKHPSLRSACSIAESEYPTGMLER